MIQKVTAENLVDMVKTTGHSFDDLSTMVSDAAQRNQTLFVNIKIDHITNSHKTKDRFGRVVEGYPIVKFKTVENALLAESSVQDYILSEGAWE